MPQMAPILWLFMVTLLTSLIYFNKTLLYFMWAPSNLTPKNKPLSTSSPSWKW